MEVLQTPPVTLPSHLSPSLTQQTINSNDSNIILESQAMTNSSIAISSNMDPLHSTVKQQTDRIDNATEETATENADESPQIDVIINNVVCTFSTRCHLNLKELALNGNNVEFKKAQGMLNMKLRKPSATASIWSSGKITVTGANSEDNSKIAARRIARKIQKLGFDVKFSSFRIVNVLGTCSLPFGILLSEFSSANIGKVSYEPELHPGATYQIKDIQATVKIFSTGSLTITAPRVNIIQQAVETVFPMVYEFRKAKPKEKNPTETKYIESMIEDDSEVELISDSSDLDLEPGELPSTKSRRFSHLKNVKKKPIRQHQVTSRMNEDDYGSQSDDDDDLDSDVSID